MFIAPSWNPQMKHIKNDKKLYSMECTLTSVIIPYKLIIKTFRKQVFFDPNLSIISPMLKPPMTSPTPKAIIPQSAFDSFYSSSYFVSYSYKNIIGVKIPDQNAIEAPVHRSWALISIIFLDTISLNTLLTKS